MAGTGAGRRQAGARIDISPRHAALHLFALCGFAVSAPIFDLLQRHPQFLVAHGCGAREVAALVAALGLALPGGLWLLGRAAVLLEARVGLLVHGALIGLLVAGIGLPPLNRAALALGTAGVLALAAAGGALAALAYIRWKPVRDFATFLALGPPVFACLFWIDPSITKVRRDGEAALASAAPVAATTPVVWVIFDELPVVSLLGADGGIDAVRYPHFAALAATSTWYRNTTSVAEYTDMAVPAMLTGRYPDAWRVPTAADHPINLFSLLGGSYALHVSEARTALHRRCGDSRVLPAAHPGTLASDLAIAFGHLVAPADLALRLPAVNEDWKDFAAPNAADLARAWSDDSYTRRRADFERFRRGIAPCREPCLYFVHVLLPHAPWRFTPSGKVYLSEAVYGIGAGRLGIWSADPWWALQGYQRHLFQVALVDTLLGQLLERLEASNLFDRALVVVTSDHGASYWPGSSRRQLTDHDHPGDILRVPLFLKAPGQRRAAVREDAVETVDILPTVMELLGVPLPWKIDGVSRVDPGSTRRSARVSVTRPGRRFTFDADDAAIGGSLAWKLATFPPGSEGGGFFAIGPHRDLVGRTPGDLPMVASTGLVAQIPEEPFIAARRSHGARLEIAPARVTGRLLLDEPASPEAGVAVAFDGAIRAVGPIYRLADGLHGFSLFIPEGADESNFRVFLVTGSPEAPVLRPAKVAFGPHLETFAVSFQRTIESEFR